MSTSSTKAGEQPGERRHRPASAVIAEVLGIVYRIAALVFIVLAVIVVIGIVFTQASTNHRNVIVRNALSLARTVAGPFKDVFTNKKPKRELEINYGLAAIVRRLPTGKR